MFKCAITGNGITIKVNSLENWNKISDKYGHLTVLEFLNMKATEANFSDIEAIIIAPAHPIAS